MPESFSESHDTSESGNVLPFIPQENKPELPERIFELTMQLQEVRKELANVMRGTSSLTGSLAWHSQVRYEPEEVTIEKYKASRENMMRLMAEEMKLEDEIKALEQTSKPHDDTSSIAA